MSRLLPVLGGLAALAMLAVAGGVAWQLFDATDEPGAASSAVELRVASAPVGVPAPVAGPARAAASSGPAVDTVDPAWVSATARATGIPEPAVRAYAAAQLAAPAGCQLGWTTLAGLGWVESQHGTIGGRTLQPDGRPSSPILGPALDGGGVAALPATPESLALTGDPTWQRAVGPLQFLVSTWQGVAADGDRDGRADPEDIDDAALAAADYLCASGQDLTAGSGWAAAVFSYNHSATYVQDVYAAASAYASRLGG